MKIDHIQLAIPTHSEDAHRAFWIGILGFSELEKPENLKPRGGAWFRLRTTEIHLGVETEFSPAKKAHPAFRVPGLNDLADKLTLANYPVRWDNSIDGLHRFFTDDPSGNRIEFIEEQ